MLYRLSYSGAKLHIFCHSRHNLNNFKNSRIAYKLGILDELNGVVLQHPKFGFTADQCLYIVEELHQACEIINPFSELSVQISDPDDKMILECAIDANADYIITGDSGLIELHPFKHIQILASDNYLEQIRV